MYSLQSARSDRPLRRKYRAAAAAAALFVLNAWICRELFTAEFLHNQLSIEGMFTSLARFFRLHPLDYNWFPWFNTGLPIENAYQPLLPVVAAITSAVTGWTDTRALHAVVALGYCLGPVTLFWFAWDWSESLAVSFSAGLAYSLTSPAEALIRELRIDASGHWGPVRLYNLVWYGEAPHMVALTLLPLAFLFLRRAIVRGGARNIVLAAVFSGAVALTNAFGAFGVALGAISLLVSLERGAGIVALAGIGAWCWISPWLPPSLLATIRKNTWTAGGFFQADTRVLLALPVTIALLAALWFVTRRARSPEATFARFAGLLALWMCAIPLGYFWLHLTLVPQASRYQLELEMGLCLLFGCAFSLMWRRFPALGRLALVVILVAAGVRQAKTFRHFARGLLRPIDISKTIEYKTAQWIGRNLPGERVFLPGDTEYVFNVFADNPQLGAGHDPSAPNWMQRVAVYTIQSGANAGDRDAEYSLFWLKAFGTQAIYVPGPASREFYHAVARPHKFDGVLPVLWHEEDDTIYRVPQRSGSLAHVVPLAALVARQPIHGLDVDPARAYVAALDDRTLPLADLQWTGPSHGLIRTSTMPGQVVSVQETWMPGWRAQVAGHAIPVRADRLGLIVIEPDCNGLCRIELSFGPTTEAWICRALSAIATLVGLACLSMEMRS